MNRRNWKHREFTDMAVVLGPNERWVEDDYADLQHAFPEVLLGYRVLLATPQTRLHGYRITKLVLVGSERYDPWFERAKHDAMGWVEMNRGKTEVWYVHRMHGIHRVD